MTKKSDGEIKMANKKTHIHYATYTKWTGKEANEVLGLQAASALHIFRSDWVLTYQGILLSLFLILQSNYPLQKQCCTKGQYFDYVPQPFTLYVEFSSVQLLFLFFLFRQCQINEHKTAWRALGNRWPYN